MDIQQGSKYAYGCFSDAVTKKVLKNILKEIIVEEFFFNYLRRLKPPAKFSEYCVL